MFAGWLNCWLIPIPISPACQRFDYGYFRYYTLLTLMAAPCTSHALRLKTQPGIFLELDRRQGQWCTLTLTHRATSRKPVAVKSINQSDACTIVSIWFDLSKTCLLFFLHSNAVVYSSCPNNSSPKLINKIYFIIILLLMLLNTAKVPHLAYSGWGLWRFAVG